MQKIIVTTEPELRLIIQNSIKAIISDYYQEFVEGITPENVFTKEFLERIESANKTTVTVSDRITYKLKNLTASLSNSTIKLLAENKIYTIGDLLVKSRKVHCIKGLGKIKIKEIQDMLEVFGIDFVDFNSI